MATQSVSEELLKGRLATMRPSLKLAFSGYLVVVAIGYIVALIQILFTHGMADGKFGLSVDDIVYSYYGNRSGTLLEQKLNGSMKMNAPDDERFEIIQWVRDGASEDAYNEKIKPIIEKRCVMCHNSNGGDVMPDFTQFENIKERTSADEGATFSSLTRVSHIHLFGIAFIFTFVCIIFSFSAGVPHALKYSAIVMPYCFLIMDIASWWLTKLNPHFAWLVIIGGGGMGLAFAFMWTVSIYEMWILPIMLKKKAAQSHQA